MPAVPPLPCFDWSNPDAARDRCILGPAFVLFSRHGRKPGGGRGPSPGAFANRLQPHTGFRQVRYLSSSSTNPNAPLGACRLVAARAPFV